MSNSEIELFHKDNFSFKEKFYILMDLLVTNQNPNRIESMIFLGISYLQIIVGFFATQIGVFNINESIFDKILFYCEKILRLFELFIDKYTQFKVMNFVFFCTILFFLIYFLIVCSNIGKNSFYSYKELIINYFIKSFIYFGYNIILDFVFSNFCFGETNPFFKGVSCKNKDNLDMVIISILLFILTVILNLILQCFYCDSMYLSTSYYARISCNYEIYTSLNSIMFSLLLKQANYLSKDIFLIYNLLISSFFFKFYINNYLYYDKNTNILAGLFHILYLWTSIFCIIFVNLDYNKKGVIYIISSIVVLYFYIHLKYKIEENIFLDTPFHKICNKSHFLYFIKNLIDKMNHLRENPKDKAILAGIMDIHSIECPNQECIPKTDEKLYLPITNEWSDRTKPKIDDNVYLINFIVIITNYFIYRDFYSPDMIINISLYYLEIIGNFCQSMYYYKKVKELKLTFQEQFSFERLKIRISKALIEKCKSPNEPCTSLEDLNVTIYFKYYDLTQQFIEEMNKDVNLSLQFWKILENEQLNTHQEIDYNKVFKLTDNIRITKRKIENIWQQLLKIYSGVNDLFNLYYEYLDQINDDDLKKRDLDEIKRKNETFTDTLTKNYYSILFNKDTGIIVANGDKGKEGIIEKVNSETEKIFKYNPDELKGLNIDILMPKLYSKMHKDFMEKYYNVGEKIIIDKGGLHSFGKDKNNSIIILKIIVKLFPMLNENVYFISIILKENIDDIIYIDGKFNIQGMSRKLMKELDIKNKRLFQDNDIPFYVICKKFVNFYKIFLQVKKNNKSKKIKKQNSILDISSFSDIGNNNENKTHKIIENENIQINENIELEYEIHIPKFMHDFSEYSHKSFKRVKTNTIISEEYIPEDINEDDKEINNSGDEFGESDLLVQQKENKNSFISNSDNQVKISLSISYLNPPLNNKNIVSQTNIPLETPTPTPNLKLSIPKNEFISHKMNLKNDNFELKNCLTVDNSFLTQNNYEYNKKEEVEKIFLTTIDKYRFLFEQGKFNDLEDFIDLNNHSTHQDYKFNFTFERYTYGNKNMSYMIRCIDNKNDYMTSDVDSLGDWDVKINKYKKEKAESIRPLFELNGDEKKKILKQIDSFYYLSTENKEFQKILNMCKEDINKMSIVHGQKKDEIMDDENSSQTSQSGYNSDLVKKNRIEEIRANILNNISNFYTLKYIKISVFSISFFTVIYGTIYLILFYKIFDKLFFTNKLNIQLFQTTIWMTNLIGSLVSLRSLFYNIKENQNFNFNSYIEDKYEYFITLKKRNYDLYNNITHFFGLFEYNIGRYIDSKNQDKFFWDKEKISYYYNDLNDTDAFPLALSQVLSDIYSLLMNKDFNLSEIVNDEKSQNYLNFISFLAIENSYDNVIPNQYLKLKIIPGLLQDSNRSLRTILFIILLIYACLMLLFCLIYSFLLHLTNKNMGEVFEKITKIRIEKIEETIKKIELFNISLKKFYEKDSQKVLDNTNSKINEEKNLSPQNINENKSLINSHESQNDLIIESNRIIPLKILNYAYLQTILLFGILCAFLIPIYLITNSMVISSNKLINVENYMFGKILIAFASTLKVKCMMNECNTKNDLVYNGLIDNNKIQKIVQGISIFQQLNIYYNDQFLLNVCKSIFELNTTDYDDCMNDILIQSANNTESLLKIHEQIIDDLYKDAILKKDTNFTLNNGTVVKFRNIYLFSTDTFKELEKIFYKYIVPVSNTFSQICLDSLIKYLKEKKNIVVILTIIFFVMVILLCVYIAFCFVNQLIHLLSVSRCILKIIPTSVINNTQELESWIENKY